MNIAASSGVYVGRSTRARRVEAAVAHVVIAVCAPRVVLAGEIVERGDHVLGVVPHRQVAADQIRIEIEQLDALSRRGGPVRAEIEEDGAAAEKRLDVAIERRGVVMTKGRQQLTLAAGPFQKRTDHGPFIGLDDRSAQLRILHRLFAKCRQILNVPA